MRRFLRFVVEQTLEGRGGELKEYLLGLEIFDRDEKFDPRIDPIVRVEARRLRAKLKTYYETDGRDETLRIELPTGSYVPRFGSRAAAAEPEAVAAAAPAGGIAVLPFANLSREPDSEYFSDGLTEELIHALTKVDGLRVVAWNSAAKLRDRQDDITQIGRELKVAAVLMGSIRTSGGRLRVMARLIEVASGSFLWSETFDRQMEDLFAIQEEISRAIVNTLRIRLIGPRSARSGVRGRSNLEAYTLYLKGRFHWNKRTREGLERAIRYFREAVALDPSLAAGHAGLADAYTLMTEHGLARPREAMPEAKAEALEALRLDPALADAHASLALIISLHEWNWVQAGEHYRRALELNPGYLTAHHWYACDYLAILGRFDEALAETALAIELDPLSAVISESRAFILMMARRPEEALEQGRRAAELDPYFYRAYTGPGRTFIQMGRYDEAIAMLERGRSLAGDLPVILGALGQAHGLRGNRAAARALLAQLSRTAAAGYVPATCFALIHLGLGEKDRALAWLEAGCDRHELSLSGLKMHPAYDGLRAEPRFAELVRRIGLAD
ncbi:MAG TPA: tetratricopeptide repeat protein [Bryobacteraceae bacterium]|nr:tetratricopeptide repeat protein [Bryobacteraceae bacterium]